MDRRPRSRARRKRGGMNSPNKKPASPTSWQAGGEHGVTGTWDHSEAKPTRLPPAVALWCAWRAGQALQPLLSYADRTDKPEWAAVEAADALDVALDALLLLAYGGGQ